MKTLRSILLISMIASTIAANASSLNGVVKDKQSGAAMPFVTVSLLKQDSTLVQGATTDDNGMFTLQAVDGKYIVKISYIGYQTIEQELLLPLKRTDNLIFSLEEEAKALEEVEVKAKRPLIERQMDKLVMNVSQSPLAAGSNGKDILNRAPGVNIDKDGNITVNGKGVEVYIDGRPSYLSGEQLKAMLEGTDGNTIEKIEIISNPSAKYDAAGQGGIINIKTKKNMMKGLNGTLSAAYGGMYWKDIQKWQSQDYVSLNLNYRTAKSYTNFQLTQVYGDYSATLESTTKVPANIEQGTDSTNRFSKSDFLGNFQYYQLHLANDWYIDEKNTFGFIVSAPIMVMRQQVQELGNYGWFVQGTDTIEKTRTHSNDTTFSPQVSGNLNFTHVFSDSLEREITVNMDYNRFYTRSNDVMHSLTENKYLGNDALVLGIGTKQAVDIYSAKADFQTKFWHTGMLETGIKWAMSNTFNEMVTDSTLNETHLTPLESKFNYSEQVAAAYITAGKQFGEHWSVKLGVRGEYTYSKGNWISADSVTTQSYFNIFPTAFLGYTTKPLGKLAQPISVNASYTRRIKRPSYYQLNPFKSYMDAHMYDEGNTELTPEFNNQVDINFGYSQYLSLAFNFSHTEGMLSQQVNILPNGDARQQWVNFGTCTTHGGNISLTELPIVPKYAKQEDGSKTKAGAWLTLTLNGGYYHFINKSYDGKFNDKSHWGTISGTFNSYLPKDWVLSLSCNWSAPITNGYNHFEGGVYTGFGIRKMYMKKGLIFNLNVQDVLRLSQYRFESYGVDKGYEMIVNQNHRQQKVMFSIVYMFGTQQYTKQRKVGQVDEASRLGGGNNNGLGQ